jgi:DNA-binding CsgD family transcriptional regulator
MNVAGVIGDLVSEAGALPNLYLFRTAALAHARRLVEFDSAIFLPSEREAPGTFNKAPEFTRTYRHYRERQQDYRADLVKGERAARDGGFIDTEVYSFGERQRLSFFCEILRPQSISSRIVAYVSFRGQPTATIHLCRHDRSRPFRPDQLVTFLRLLPAIALAQAALRVGAGAGTLPAELDGLSPRERQIVEYVRCGHSNKEIAQLLGTSPLTVRNQLSRVFRRLDIDGRAGLAAWAERSITGRRSCA